MKSFFAKTLVASLALSAQSWAIFGIGAHWAPNKGLKTKEINDVIYEKVIEATGVTPEQRFSATFLREEATDLQGFGIKAWVDFLPLVDIEATVNFQVDTYQSSLVLNYPDAEFTPQEIRQDLELEVEGGDLFSSAKATPLYGLLMADFSVLVPYELPLPVLQINIYAGTGLTYYYATPLVTKELATKIAESTMNSIVAAAESADAEALQQDPAAAGKEIAEAIAAEFKDEGVKQGVGGHVLVGARFSVALIPLAIYANGKYHFGGVDADVTHGMTLELGGGLAF